MKIRQIIKDFKIFINLKNPDIIFTIIVQDSRKNIIINGEDISPELKGYFVSFETNYENLKFIGETCFISKVKYDYKNAIVADGRCIEFAFENAIKKLENAK